jgi:hypothetical protein
MNSFLSSRSPRLTVDSWVERVVRQMGLQTEIEAAFDRAEAFERLGDFKRALDWLERASALSGGLSQACLAQRSRYVDELGGRKADDR